MSRAASQAADRPFRIGVWGDYGSPTMLPRPMLAALERMLLDVLGFDTTLEIVLLVPSDVDALAPIARRLHRSAPRRVRTLPPSSPLERLRRVWKRDAANADARAAHWLARADSHVWLLPHAAVRFPLDVPTVALLHDDATQGLTGSELTRAAAPGGLLGRSWPSPSGAMDVIGQSYYRRWLGRPAGDDERRVWIRELERGAPEEEAIVIFLSSPEYRRNRSDDPVAWVESVHEHLFGRRPSAAESSRAVESIERGTRHEDLLRSILAEPEWAAARSARCDRRWRGRPPDRAGLEAKRLADALVALRAAEATFCVLTERGDAGAPDSALRLGVSARSRRIPIDEPGHAAEWVETFRDAGERGRWPRSAVLRAADDPWPVAEVAAPVRHEAFVFLQDVSRGGVWEVTKDVLAGVAAVARERGTLSVTIGLEAEHTGLAELAAITDGIDVRPFRLAALTSAEASRVAGTPLRSPAGFCFFAGAEREALRADAWLALTDRFPLPLLPARPYAVLVHDIISRHVPDAFDEEFFTLFEAGMRPTARGAERFVVTNEVTGRDAAAEYGLRAEQQRLIPVTWDAARRFGAKRPRRVARVKEPFLLNVTNAHPHKGTLDLLHAFARLRREMSGAPSLVVCGGATETFSARHVPAFQSAYHRAVREAVAAYELREDEDVYFLGYVTDEELIDLYERSALVVNAARGDNGCFNSIEAAFFGRPAVSTRYPAAQWLRARFAIPLRFYDANDASDFVAAVQAALADGAAAPAEVAALRRHLASEEFSNRRYAERFYELLCELASLGRARRSSATVTGS